MTASLLWPTVVLVGVTVAVGLLTIAAAALDAAHRAGASLSLGQGVSVRRTSPRAPPPPEVIRSVAEQLESSGGAYVALPSGELRVTRSNRGGWWLEIDGVASHHTQPDELAAAIAGRLATRAAVREVCAEIALRRRMP